VKTNSPKILTLAPRLGAVGLQPYESRNIRLSSALCAFGFALRINAEPATVIIDYDTKRPIVAFWHDMTLPVDSKIRQQLPSLTANHLGLWWSKPKEFSIEGYNDALLAIRRVFEVREWLIKVVKGAIRVPHDARNVHNSVSTQSLHIASIIKATTPEPGLLAFDKGTFVFGPQAAPIAALLDHTSTRAENQHTDDGSDRCVDWMVAALKYRDWLHRIVKSKGCVPLIEKRDGDRFLRISSQMPKTLRREFTSRF
jgi:hypothetical protein